MARTDHWRLGMTKEQAKERGKGAGASPARRAGDRGRYGRLSRERVLASALELVDQEGLSAPRMLAVPLAQRPLAVLKDHERVLALLREAGLDETRVPAVFRAFTAWLLGYVSTELRPMVDNADEPDPAFRLGLHRMPPQELPT